MERNDEILNSIKDDVELYKKAVADRNDRWKAESDIESRINRNILRLTQGDEMVNRIESFIGKFVMYGDGGDVKVFKAEKVDYGKWEFTVSGAGINYHFGTLYHYGEINVKYDEIEETLANIKIPENGAIQTLIDSIEAKRDSDIKKYVAYINEQCDKAIAEIKSYMEHPEQHVEEDDELPGLDDSAKEANAVMDSVSRYRMDDLIRDYGSDKMKAELPQEPVDVIDNGNEEKEDG